MAGGEAQEEEGGAGQAGGQGGVTVDHFLFFITHLYCSSEF